MSDPKPFAWYWYDSHGCLYITGDERKPEIPSTAKPLFAEPAKQSLDHINVDSLSQEIRRVDGNHSLGAGALAEALMPFIEGREE